jgi:hypothetical protein
MKRAIFLSTAFAVLPCLSVFPLMAQGRGGGGAAGNPGMGQGQMGNRPMNGPGLEQPGMNRGLENTTNGPMTQQKTPSQLLAENTKLSKKLQNLLPADEKVQDAASGFKNLGEFVAAVHVAHNLNIPFDQFKNKVTIGDSLGKAVHALNPKLNHKEIMSQVKKGKQQAKEDIKTAHHS